MIWFRVNIQRVGVESALVSFPDLGTHRFAFKTCADAECLSPNLASEIVDRMIGAALSIPTPEQSGAEVELALPTAIRLSTYWSQLAVGLSPSEASMGLVRMWDRSAEAPAQQCIVLAAKAFVQLIQCEAGGEALGKPEAISIEGAYAA